MPYRISYLKPRLLIQPQNSRMKSPNQTEIAYQLSNLGSICTGAGFKIAAALAA